MPRFSPRCSVPVPTASRAARRRSALANSPSIPTSFCNSAPSAREVRRVRRRARIVVETGGIGDSCAPKLSRSSAGSAVVGLKSGVEHDEVDRAGPIRRERFAGERDHVTRHADASRDGARFRDRARVADCATGPVSARRWPRPFLPREAKRTVGGDEHLDGGRLRARADPETMRARRGGIGSRDAEVEIHVQRAAVRARAARMKSPARSDSPPRRPRHSRRLFHSDKDSETGSAPSS